MAEGKLKAANLPVTDENVFIVATCGDKGVLFLEGKGKVAVRKTVGQDKEKDNGGNAIPSDKPCCVTLDGCAYTVALQDHKVTVNGHTYAFDIKALDAAAPARTEPAKTAVPLAAPLPGVLLRYTVREGETVSKDQTVLILESMKMETEIKAPASGVIALKSKQGDQVQTGDLLAEVMGA